MRKLECWFCTNNDCDGYRFVIYEEVKSFPEKCILWYSNSYLEELDSQQKVSLQKDIIKRCKFYNINLDKSSLNVWNWKGTEL